MIEKKKSRLRQELLAERNRLSQRERQLKSQRIKQALFDLDEFKKAPVVAFYVSFGSEVKTDQSIEESLRMGKTVVVPFCKVREKDLGLHIIENPKEELGPGAFGILEPKAKTREEFVLANVDFMTIPGIVFDLQGHRLGYGQGFYDKFLSRISKAHLVGLAFELQIVERLPRLPHDISVERIVTEERVIDCR